MEVVSEESAVAVWVIFTSVECDVWHLSNFGVNLIILSVGRVKVGTSEFISSVFSQNFLEDPHSHEVRVLEFGCLKEDTNINVGHFIVSHVEHGWCEEWLFSICDVGASWSLTGELTEILFAGSNETIVVKVACTYNV